jgi:hypothetical protein
MLRMLWMMRSVVGGPEAPLEAGCDDMSARAPRPGSAELGVAAASSESASRINTALRANCVSRIAIRQGPETRKNEAAAPGRPGWREAASHGGGKDTQE